MRILAFILAFLAAGTLDYGTAHAQAANTAKSAETRLSRITIRSVGEGTPVVLIPGLASSTAVYDGVAANLARNHRLILVQVNGFAGNKAGDAPIGGLLPGAVDELAGWLAANRIEKPAVVGHSMGGLMAMMLAKAHPAAAGKLLIVDSLPFFGMLMGPGATPDTIRPMVEQMRDGLVSGKVPPEVPPHMSNTDAGKAKILEWQKASDPRIVGEALVEDATTDFRPDLPALKDVSVTVLYAAATPEFKPIADGLYREAYKALPGAKLIAVEHSEHFIMLDQPQAFAAALDEFLK